MLVVILAMLAMFFNYNLKLDRRTLTLEKKNGHEQHQIDELKKKITDLEQENKQLHHEIKELKERLSKYQTKRKAIEY